MHLSESRSLKTGQAEHQSIFTVSDADLLVTVQVCTEMTTLSLVSSNPYRVAWCSLSPGNTLNTKRTGSRDTNGTDPGN